jgi:hypothetical protein
MRFIGLARGSGSQQTHCYEQQRSAECLREAQVFVEEEQAEHGRRQWLE